MRTALYEGVRERALESRRGGSAQLKMQNRVVCSMTRESCLSGTLVIVDTVATTKKCKLVLSPSRSNLGLVRSYWWKIRQNFEIYNLGMVSGPVLKK